MDYETLVDNLNNRRYEPVTRYSENPAQYRKENAECEERFRFDLFATFEVSDNPKADKAYSIAWSHGHSSGYYEVMNYFSELVELIR